VTDRLRLLADLPSDDGKPTASVLVPLFEDEASDLRVVLIKRPETMPTHAGHIALPGGRPHPGDRDPVHTALREAEEEVGIPQKMVEVWGYLPAIHTVEFSLMVIPVVGLFDRKIELVPSPREVAGIFTPALDQLAEPDLWVFDIWQGRRVWFFDLGGELLWGATARILRWLVGLDALP
jgi:8-oxo-dGTP pyrophosphatase MutT (NUDIX family)